LKIAILGAESTGKTELTQQLTAHFETLTPTQDISRVHLVPEYLREWCDAQSRTPRPDEQLGIATEQARRVDASMAYDWLITDTTPLMIAIYSDMLFDDQSLYDMALAHQRSYDLTMVTGLDLPWVADGLQRDGPHVREPVDALIRAALAQGKIDYQVVYGAGELRLANALKCIEAVDKSHLPETALAAAHASMTETSRQTWVCERCSDPECEHRLFTSLLPKS
jgi:nicotinamide riboside kinase